MRRGICQFRRTSIVAERPIRDILQPSGLLKYSVANRRLLPVHTHSQQYLHYPGKTGIGHDSGRSNILAADKLSGGTKISQYRIKEPRLL